jgi:hypothetical protein
MHGFDFNQMELTHFYIRCQNFLRRLLTNLSHYAGLGPIFLNLYRLDFFVKLFSISDLIFPILKAFIKKT